MTLVRASIGVAAPSSGGRPDPERVQQAAEELARLGFEILRTGRRGVSVQAEPERFAGSQTFRFARTIVHEIVNVYALKMAAVFMFVTSTLALRTRFLARWIAVLGYAIALVLILSSRYVEWQLLSFPLWVLLVSFYILWDSGIHRR